MADTDGGDQAQMQNVAVEVDQTQPAAPAAAPAPASSGGGPTGFSGDSIKANLLAPDGILRIVEWFCAMIAFSAAVDIDNYDKCDSGTTCERLQFLVFVNVTLWLITMGWMVIYLLGLRNRYGFMIFVEIACDVLWCLFEFAAGVAMAARCEEKKGYCGSGRNEDNIRAAAAFSIITFLLLCGSIFFDVKRYKAQ